MILADAVAEQFQCEQTEFIEIGSLWFKQSKPCYLMGGVKGKNK